MRLFVGLLPPRPVCDELARALGPHRAAWPRLRWIDRENWHLTLAFLGEVPEEVLPGLEVRLGRAASRYAPMTLAFTGAGAFPRPAGRASSGPVCARARAHVRVRLRARARAHVRARNRMRVRGPAEAGPRSSAWPTPWPPEPGGREPYRWTRASGSGRT
nr:hypothetical protein GCM10020093_066220 [Planobispora longispora]